MVSEKQPLEDPLEGGFEMVTPTTCQAAIEDMRREEDRYWQEDMDDDEADE